MNKRLILEAKKVVELAVVKSLTGAKLSAEEVNEICSLSESDLMRDFGCDLYMAEAVKLHGKRELFRLRAQNQFTKIEGLWNETGYPNKPYTRTEYVKESVSRRLSEDHHRFDRDEHMSSPEGSGRMLDYGHNKSDSEEGRMMKQFLRDAAVDAYRLHQMLEDDDDLPQWCHYKIAQVQQMIGSVRNYLEYKFERMGDDLVGEREMFDPQEMVDDFGEDSAEAAMSSWAEQGPDTGDQESFDMGYMAGKDPGLDMHSDLPEETEDSEYDDFEDVDYDEPEDLEDEDLEDEDLEDEDLEDEDLEDEDLEDDFSSGFSDEYGFNDDGYDGADAVRTR